MSKDTENQQPKWDGKTVEFQCRIPLTRIEMAGIAALIKEGWRIKHNEQA